MGTLDKRLRRLDELTPPRRDNDFDIQTALSFRVAGLLKAVVIARIIVMLDDLSHRRGCPDSVKRECRERITAHIHAFKYYGSTEAGDHPLPEDRDRVVLEAARRIVRDVESELQF